MALLEPQLLCYPTFHLCTSSSASTAFLLFIAASLPKAIFPAGFPSPHLQNLP